MTISPPQENLRSLGRCMDPCSALAVVAPGDEKQQGGEREESARLYVWPHMTGISGPVDKRPLLLVIGSGSPIWREYLLRSMSKDCDIWLFSAVDVTWETPYVVGSTKLDALDHAAAVEAAEAVHRRLGVSGVLSYDEIRVPIAAAVADALGLPGGGLEAVAACRDKAATRRAFTAAGVPQPYSYAVSSLEEATERAAALGYPVVVKPRALAGSLGVTLVASAEDLPAAYTATRGVEFTELPRLEAGVLVESFADGPEISIDSACHNGRVTPLFVARKKTGFAPHFEEVGHVVSARDPLLTDPEITRILQDAHTALGLSTLMTHTEVRLTGTGPKVIEVNARLGGDLIPYTAQLATGVDYGDIAARLALGIAPTAPELPLRTAQIDFLYPGTDIEVEALTVGEDGLPTEVHTVIALVGAGRKLRLPPRDHVRGRFAVVITAAGTPEACEAAKVLAEKHVELPVRRSTSRQSRERPPAFPALILQVLMNTSTQDAVLLLDPVNKGANFKSAVRERGLAIVSVYTLEPAELHGRWTTHTVGDDVTLYASQAGPSPWMNRKKVRDDRAQSRCDTCPPRRRTPSRGGAGGPRGGSPGALSGRAGGRAGLARHRRGRGDAARRPGPGRGDIRGEEHSRGAAVRRGGLDERRVCGSRRRDQRVARPPRQQPRRAEGRERQGADARDPARLRGRRGRRRPCLHSGRSEGIRRRGGLPGHPQAR
ncbi:acetyl-CoA carboxylase biotin carboxylase subunit family protein [Streptomyces sp. NPDC097617]|uniref:ATP-grasp domain-containing protein n=1 Tax=Streptomyces sp. NPDC097617 TaxID=3366091 RepID=UPI003806042B